MIAHNLNVAGALFIGAGVVLFTITVLAIARYLDLKDREPRS